MPAGVNEELWNRAKAIVRKEYPKIADGSTKFYKLTMTIYQNMKGESKPKSQLEKTI